jgi:urease accessory protein
MTDPIDPEHAALQGADVLRLLTWLSPSFPVGAFSYSHGLEWAVEDGTVGSAPALADWIEGIVRHGAGRTDAVLLCASWRATRAGGHGRLAGIAQLAMALQPSRERRLESGAQGRAFCMAIAATWEAPTLAALTDDLGEIPVAYPVAIGVAAADHGVPLGSLCEAFLTAFVANLVSAAVRAVPLGQTDGQRVIRDMARAVTEVAGEALAADPEDVGGAALRADIASMRHESQYTRLFRS